MGNDFLGWVTKAGVIWVVFGVTVSDVHVNVIGVMHSNDDLG